jgi:uncharacterized protein (AIM24 family)
VRCELLHNPTSGVVHVTFQHPREQLVARASALVARDTSIDARTTRPTAGADGREEARREDDDPTTTLFTATAPGQSLWLAAPAEGTVASIAIARGAELFIQSSSWLARTPDVGLDTSWHGARTFFPRGATLARAWGEGELWYGAYGGLHVVEIGTTHESYAAAADHVVAFTEGVQHRPRRGDPEGRKARKGGDGDHLGEGWVDFSGAGRLWLQTRNPTALAGFLHPFRRVGGPTHPAR